MGNLEEGKLTSALSAQQNVEVPSRSSAQAISFLPGTRKGPGSRSSSGLGSSPGPGPAQASARGRGRGSYMQVVEYCGDYQHVHDAVRPAATGLVMIYRAVRVDGSHNDNTRTDPHQPQTLGPSDQTCRILAPLPRTHLGSRVCIAPILGPCPFGRPRSWLPGRPKTMGMGDGAWGMGDGKLCPDTTSLPLLPSRASLVSQMPPSPTPDSSNLPRCPG